jgi:hypothetical protein
MLHVFTTGHAATMQSFSCVEPVGMLFLSIGPLVNLLSCACFRLPNDPLFLYNKQWCTTEVVEFLGMCVLDISLIHMDEEYVLATELLGFATLCAAAFLQFSYTGVSNYPALGYKVDEVHLGECAGLIILSIVAVVQYREKAAVHYDSGAHKAEVRDRYVSPRASPASVTDIEVNGASQCSMHKRGAHIV